MRQEGGDRLGKGKKQKPLIVAIVIGIIIALGLVMAFSGNTINIDFTKYNYTDDEIEPQSPLLVIQEFSDFQCGHCASVQKVLKSIKLKYDGKVSVRMNHYPMFDHSDVAAEAAECARDQNRFWAYHDLLFDNQDIIPKEPFSIIAEGLGLDVDQFNNCLDNAEKLDIIGAGISKGKSLGIRGTPFFVVGDEIIRGTASFDTFDLAVQQVLEKLEV